jgi:ribosome recycling factor
MSFYAYIQETIIKFVKNKMGNLIQITIQKTAKPGEPEMAKTYNTAFEGNMNDLKRVQNHLDNEIEKILWDKKSNKTIDEEQAV